jgi:ABC-2 type transport system ATP-binding protein
MNMHTASEFSTPQLIVDSAKTVIRFDNVAVRYRLPHEGVSGVKEYAIRLLQRKIHYDDFWALKGVSFEVRHGEVFGIIGRNGAGKSTMLKVMARVLQPTEGRVVMSGQIAPLLELGGGFHPELTGRENVYLNMALLGYSRKQTQALFESIIDFAEIPEFIDAPIRTYSTGMVARLGFAVATCTQPDILLVDEVLSVGDTQFQQKCLDRMNAFQQKGTTIVIVSHSMAVVQSFCERGLWLNRGKVEFVGDVDMVVEHYIHNSDPTQTSSAHIPPKTGRDDFTQLYEVRKIYPARDIFVPEQGSLTVWLKFRQHIPGSIAMIFHSDDSRYVIYSQAAFDEENKREIYWITARAGGNQRASQAGNTFPELSAAVEFNPILGQDWHLVALTWNGFPEGKLNLYLDGECTGQQEYDARWNDSRPMPSKLAIGQRPLNWQGELIYQEDGSVADSRPGSTMGAEENQVEIHDMRLHRRQLTEDEVKGLYNSGHPQEN